MLGAVPMFEEFKPVLPTPLYERTSTPEVTGLN